MPLIFESKVGQVIQLDDPAAQCTSSRPLFSMDPGIDWNNYRAIVTRVTLSQQVNVQFLHTMSQNETTPLLRRGIASLRQRTPQAHVRCVSS